MSNTLGPKLSPNTGASGHRIGLIDLARCRDDCLDREGKYTADAMNTAASVPVAQQQNVATARELSFQTYLEIADKKSQYGRYLDTKQWDKFRLIARPDAQFHFEDANEEVLVRNGKSLRFDRRDAFVEYFGKFFADAQTLHMFGPPQIVMEEEEKVNVTWAIADQLCFSSGTLIELRGECKRFCGLHVELTGIVATGSGYYVETWIRQAEEWWLSSLVLTRSYTKVGFT